MSGRKQHYLPQFLQRGFAHPTPGGEWQSWVYRKDRSYKSNTKGIGAERDFYIAGELDADIPITDAEREFAALLRELRDQEPGPISREGEISRFLVHLESRTAQLRAILYKDMQFGVDEVLKAVDDPATLKQLFQEHAPEVMRPLAEMVEMPMFQNQWRSVIAQIKEVIIEKLEGAVQKGQVKALSADVAPSMRVDELRGIEYRVYTSNEELVLGDSAVFFKIRDIDDFRPFRDKGAVIDFVALPLSPTKVLIGGTALPTSCPTGLLMAAIRCSHEFFISPEEKPDLKQALPLIGSNAVLLSNSEKMRLLGDIFKR